MAESAPPQVAPRRKKDRVRFWVWLTFAFVVVFLFGIALGPVTGSISKARALEARNGVTEIAVALRQYASDHQGEFPPGKSSTEIFQALIAGGYITDLGIFFEPGSPGKIRPVWNQKLKPYNVCYDITVPLTANSAMALPIVFMTGFRIEYKPGGRAVPLSDAIRKRKPYMVGFFENGRGAFYPLAGDYEWPAIFTRENDPDEMKLRRDGTIDNFISPLASPIGKNCQQLTPDGPLTP